MSRPPIDLTQLSERDLVELNRKIVERLRYLRDSRAHHQMLEFRPGDQVNFSPEPGRKVLGTILRLNRKSVTLITGDGVQWRVSPSLLIRAEPKDVEVEVVEEEKEVNDAPERQGILPLRVVPMTTNFLTPPSDTSRNAPCPCGSGKKHKRCCLLNGAVGHR